MSAPRGTLVTVLVSARMVPLSLAYCCLPCMCGVMRDVAMQTTDAQNWRNTTGMVFPFAVAVDYPVATVESALTGKLPFTQDSGSARVHITLPSLPGTSDFISITRR
jgi:hypothetical protein